MNLKFKVELENLRFKSNIRLFKKQVVRKMTYGLIIITAALEYLIFIGWIEMELWSPQFFILGFLFLFIPWYSYKLAQRV